MVLRLHLFMSVFGLRFSDDFQGDTNHQAAFVW
jgi:hypothetical protein